MFCVANWCFKLASTVPDFRSNSNRQNASPPSKLFEIRLNCPHSTYLVQGPFRTAEDQLIVHKHDMMRNRSRSIETYLNCHDKQQRREHEQTKDRTRHLYTPLSRRVVGRMRMPAEGLLSLLAPPLSVQLGITVALLIDTASGQPWSIMAARRLRDSSVQTTMQDSRSFTVRPSAWSIICLSLSLPTARFAWLWSLGLV